MELKPVNMVKINAIKSLRISVGQGKRKSSYSYAPGIPELLNLQNVKGKAKPYQIKQFLQLIEIHNLQMEEE